MFHFRKGSKNTRNKKNGVKDENIDRQIRVLHQAMVKKLIEQPLLSEKIKLQLEEKHQQGRLGYGPYLTWCSLLEWVETQPEKFIEEVCKDSAYMRRLRRSTPLTGLLSETERQQALDCDAAGTTDISTLF